MSKTKLPPSVTDKALAVIAVMDAFPAIVKMFVTPKEAAEIRARIDALNSLLIQHISEAENDGETI